MDWLVIGFLYVSGYFAAFLLMGAVHLRSIANGTETGTSKVDVAMWAALSLVWPLPIWTALIVGRFVKK